MTARDLPLRYLEEITDGFSDSRKVGSGGYGEVYKGVERAGTEIAVKKLYHMSGIDDTQFRNEFNNLMKIQHPNIVRMEALTSIYVLVGLLGCVHPVGCRGLVLPILQKQESHGLDWCTRYKIIKGTCEGLYYLHERLKESIYHLDLKPANILLDKNMDPKIADFGLSRLFGGTQTHTTRNCKGTELIIAGPLGYSKCDDMPPQQFIELVCKKWRDRMEATSNYASTEEDCQRLKRCIEIALRCVEVERKNRPSMRDIIRELKQIDETSSSMSSWNKVRIAKIGQWGGIGGNYRDIEVAPCRLGSLMIGCGEVIYSIAFSYYDYNGQQHKVGPWGGDGPDKGVNHTIQFSLSEYLTGISGTIASSPYGVIITSLTLVTNTRTYGPYGQVGGTPFQIPIQIKGSIVGFFGRVGWYVDAFGIYVNPNQDATHEDEAAVVKIGPWGANEGEAHDIDVLPCRLESVAICSSDYVESFGFSYSDRSGHQHTAGPWGRPGGNTHTVQLGSSEFLIGFSGTTGPSSTLAKDVVTSLTLITNARSYGPFGQVEGSPFQVPMRNNASIIGFFGRGDLYVNAIGVYINPEQEKIEQEAGITKIGPWGGNGGNAQDIDITMQPQRLESITISCGAVVDSLAFTYADKNGHKHAAGPWGGNGGRIHKIELGPSEFVTKVYGTIGPFGKFSSVITSIHFTTNADRYGPFGQGTGTRFEAPMHSDGSIVGFFGRTSSYVDAIGFYVVPV
uniref:non-specific serine/threonine protein kinase n=1 Tax=Oryza sativa subsp. japonica TaxID=39947 RepID=Q2R1E7_ORYSJ|nr:Jacalin-like lectin domain containing protein [Oryza sativa Japonica Group]